MTGSYSTFGSEVPNTSRPLASSYERGRDTGFGLGKDRERERLEHILALPAGTIILVGELDGDQFTPAAIDAVRTLHESTERWLGAIDG